MNQRVSGYARKERDQYETPEWVTQAVIPHLPGGITIAEPACASGKIVNALKIHYARPFGFDIQHGEQYDFLKITGIGADGIVTNPPYDQAQEFIEHSLRLMKPRGGFVAMLLRTDFDHAKTRRHLFAHCSAFAKKLVLTKRIVWFEPAVASPSFNHAWFIWDWRHKGPPILAYHVID